CRAGTTTPFHFGEIISTDLANYDGNYTYGDGLKGVHRKGTTDVGFFPPNLFGLHDMHGNVWEWCLDDWHNNYEGAPTDGSAWINRSNDRKVRRGGSWYDFSDFCRSASRNWDNAKFNYNNFGFRVVCDAT
ncbi:MAG: formylglycine-generating enzyme family protein, partial [Dolichospermum sp.]